jgi:HlyD family secretion protein
MRPRNAILLALGIGAIAAMSVWALRPQRIAVETAEVSTGVFEQTINDDGRTRVRDRYTVSAPLAGRVQRIDLRVGDAVVQDAVVAAILPSMPELQDPRTVRELRERSGAAQASVSRAGALEARATVALDQARSDAARATRLAAQGFISSANLEQATLTASMREKELEAARFERQAAERELAQARAALMRVSDQAATGRGAASGFPVRAPVSGRVLKVVHESEGPVTLGAPLIELGDVSRLEVVVDVLSTEAVAIPPGVPVHIDAGAGRGDLQGRVRLVEPTAFTKISALGVEEQRVNVVIDPVAPVEPWQSLGHGYRVDARIVIHRVDEAILIPSGALFRDGAAQAVFVVEDGIARKRSVEVPRHNDRVALVAKGLQPGERVVVFPGDTLKEGSRVRPR